MSGDMLTNLLLEGDSITEKQTYKELELKKWKEFKKICLLNHNTLLNSDICRYTDLKCEMNRCHAKQIKLAIEAGLL